MINAIILVMKKSLFLLPILLLVASCNPTSNRNYSEFNEFRLDDLNNLYTQKENHYGVYLYNEDCSHCEKNKERLFNYLDNYKIGVTTVKIYLYNTIRLLDELPNYDKNSDWNDKSSEEIRNILIENKVSTIEKTPIIGWPSLYMVKNNVINYFETGYKTMDYIEAFQNSNDYSDYDNFKLDNLENLYNQEEKTYYVYLYREDCPSCQNIKYRIFRYLELYKEDSTLTKMYIYDTKRLRSENPIYNKDFTYDSNGEYISRSEEEVKNYLLNNNVSTLKDTPIAFVPSLYVIENNAIKDFKGELNIIDYLGL